MQVFKLTLPAIVDPQKENIKRQLRQHLGTSIRLLNLAQVRQKLQYSGLANVDTCTSYWTTRKVAGTRSRLWRSLAIYTVADAGQGQTYESGLKPCVSVRGIYRDRCIGRIEFAMVLYL